MHEGEPGFVFANGGFPLPVERGVDERELPGGRRLARHDAVPASVEVEVFGFVGYLMNAGESGTDGEVDVAQQGMLRRMEANGDRARVAGADLEVDIADGRVEGTRVGVGHGAAGWHHSAWGRRKMEWRRPAACRAGARAGEEKHVGDAVLVARGVFAQHKDRPLRAVANDPYARPEIDGASDAITALRDKHDAFALGGLQLVDGRLHRSAIVLFAVAVSVEFFRGEIHRCGVIEAHRVSGRGQARDAEQKNGGYQQ